MKRLLLLIVLIALLALPMLATAQESTAEPTPAPEVTPEPTASPTEQPPVELPDDAVIITTGQLLFYLGLALLGGGGIFAVFAHFLGRKEVRDLAEKLYQSTSPENQKIINELVAGYRDISEKLLDFANAITDGKPN